MTASGHAGSGASFAERAPLVDEVHGEEELTVGQQIVGRSLGDDAVVLGEHHAPVGEEIMSAPDTDRWTRDLGYKGDFVHMLLLPILQPGATDGELGRARESGEFRGRFEQDLVAGVDEDESGSGDRSGDAVPHQRGCEDRVGCSADDEGGGGD